MSADEARDLLQEALIDEPTSVRDADAVYLRAERIRRRRIRTAIATAGCAVVLVVLTGYGLTEAMIPRLGATLVAQDTAGIPSPPASSDPDAVDPVQALATAAANRHNVRLVRERPARGIGWRRYTVLGDEAASPKRGTLLVSLYTTPGGLCFPMPSGPEQVCATPKPADGQAQFVSYPRSNQIIVRRWSDGRTVVVVAAGVTKAGGARQGEPPLDAAGLAELAKDVRLPDAFGSQEWCDSPDPSCPALPVPLPAEG